MKPYIKYILLFLLIVFIINRLYNRENFTEDIGNLLTFNNTTGEIMVQSSTDLQDQITTKAQLAQVDSRGVSESDVDVKLADYVTNVLPNSISSGFDRNTYLHKSDLNSFVASSLGGYMRKNKNYNAVMRNGKYIFTPYEGEVLLIGASVPFNNYMEYRLKQVAYRTCMQTMFLSELNTQLLNRSNPLYFKEEWDQMSTNEQNNYGSEKEFVASVEDVDMFRLHSYLLYVYLVRLGAQEAEAAEAPAEPTLPPIDFNEFLETDPIAKHAQEKWTKDGISIFKQRRSYSWEKTLDKSRYSMSWRPELLEERLVNGDWSTRVKKYHKYRKLALEYTYPKELYNMREDAKMHGFPNLPGEEWSRSYRSYIDDLTQDQQKNFRDVNYSDIDLEFVKESEFAPFKAEDTNERRRNIYVGMVYFAEAYARKQALASSPGPGTYGAQEHKRATGELPFGHPDSGWDNIENTPKWHELYLNHDKASDTNDRWGHHSVNKYRQNPTKYKPIAGNMGRKSEDGQDFGRMGTTDLNARHISRFATGVKISSEAKRMQTFDITSFPANNWYNNDWSKSYFDKFANREKSLREQAEESLMNYYNYRRFSKGIKPGDLNMWSGINGVGGKTWRSAMAYWRGGKTYKQKVGWDMRSRMNKQGASAAKATLDPDYQINFPGDASERQNF